MIKIIIIIIIIYKKIIIIIIIIIIYTIVPLKIEAPKKAWSLWQLA